MTLPSLSFLIGLGILFYVTTFFLFAVLRFITGVSIQRVGVSGLRRIAYSPRNGLSIRVRGLGLSLHRPTFAQPTWVSVLVTEPQILIDLPALSRSQSDHQQANKTTDSKSNGSLKSRKKETDADGAHLREERNRKWRELIGWKERLKRLQRQIQWLQLVDVVVDRASVLVKDVGSLRMERFTVGVDTRPTTVDRSRLFQHHQTRTEKQQPAEWRAAARSLSLTPEGKESSEILDQCTLSVHGFLHKELEGLRDATIAFKMGRLTVPYDDLDGIMESMQRLRPPTAPGDKNVTRTPTPALNDDEYVIQNEVEIVQAVQDSQAFVNSILRGIQEVQIAVSFFGLSKRIKTIHASGQHVYLNLAMKEVGLDLMRLDNKSPAHRMYFARDDVAHQALLTAIAIAAGVDDGHDHPERMFYIPMVTATVKTTLPYKTIQRSTAVETEEMNSNLLLANAVCTSPSIDLDPKHLPLVMAVLKSQQDGNAQNKQSISLPKTDGFIARLLPKATIKLAVQEPVVRVSLPRHGQEGEYDMIISSTSSMSLDIEAQHRDHGAQEYSLLVNYRQTSHRFYGQTATGNRHDLLVAETVDIKTEISALPEATLHVIGGFHTVSVFLDQPEICEGVRQIVHTFRRETESPPGKSSTNKISFLRRVPKWLQYVRLEGSDFNVEVAGVDEAISKYARGMAVHLESCSMEYKAHREQSTELPSRRRSVSHAPARDHSPHPTRPPASRKKSANFTDDRRLAIHIDGLKGLITDSIENSTPDAFLALPQFEIAFTTSTDAHGLLFHINSYAKRLSLYYSLYNHFAIGIAFLLIRRTFVPPVSDDHVSDAIQESQEPHRASLISHDYGQPSPVSQDLREITSIDFKAGVLQIKADMPADPPMMLQIYGVEAGQHRWASPFFRTKLVRLYVGTPRIRSVWTRIVTLKSTRFDVRSSKRKSGKQMIQETSMDIATEAVRIGVPHGLIVHSIFDNITNVMKTSKQMHHHFVTGSNEYILAKSPEGPKQLPKISFKAQLLIFEIEDSAFEYKLGTIYRAGLTEQRQRLAREDAFQLKCKRLHMGGQGKGSQNRSLSAQHRGRKTATPEQGNSSERRSQSARGRHSDGDRRHRNLRYDATGTCDMSGNVARTREQAREALNRFNAQSWRRRIDRAMSSQAHAIQDIRSYFWGVDEVPEGAEETEPVMAPNQRPGLATVCISDLSIGVNKPSFPLRDLPQFMHDVGKGMPLDMQYGLLLPMHLTVTMGEARAMLRDYPLPLVHIPAIRAGQSPRLPSLSLSTDFVIAEEYRDIQSQRHVDVVVVPANKFGPDDHRTRFAIDVRRTISPVKTYSNMKFDINTSAPTRITWGTSYQPVIQDMMQVIEGFTKPPMDPSDRVGFWDKIRLGFHSRILVSWKGDGDVHLNFKGARDPYVVTGYGAGFVMVWRNNVTLRINQAQDPRRFMTVDSGDYILAIPDFNHYARHAVDGEDTSDNGSSSTDTAKSTAMFKKVIMKLSGNVQWIGGLVFEQASDDRKKRRFDFKPHYEVVLKHPDYAKASPSQTYDAYRGLRSHHIHMSIAVIAPQSRDWEMTNAKPSDNYNSVHLTPRFFTHFLNWWSLFSGIMSLPIRQGPLWSSEPKASKKFGRHLATIKYNLLLSPVFIAHIYKHKEAEDYNSDVVAATGVKMKLDSFILDLHQRRETFEINGDKNAAIRRTSGMRINQCQLDLESGDIRAVSASIHGTTKKDIDRTDDADLSSFQGSSKVDMSRFTIPDNDFAWIDMDDFVELDWILPQESNPATKILPLASAPRFTYFRQTDHGDSVSGDTTRTSPFGDEPTHFCVMSARNDPRRIQAELIQHRLDMIVEQMAANKKRTDEHELKVIRGRQGDSALRDKFQTIKNHSQHLQRKYDFLDSMLKTLLHRLDAGDSTAVPGLETSEPLADGRPNKGSEETTGTNAVPLADYTSDFNNRFVVHNAHIKWNNSLRNIILRYIHQVSQRRGFVYYMSRRAIKFILDIIDEKHKAPSSKIDLERNASYQSSPLSPEAEDDLTVRDRIEQILADGKAYVEADDPDSQKAQTKPAHNKDDDISTEFTAQNSYHFRLIAPQVQLQSEKNPKSAVLIAAKGVQLKVVQIMDKDRITDEISGLVQRRFNAEMDSLQVFVTSTKTFSTEYLHLYSGYRYGTKAGSYWPPWVPMEVMYEFEANPYGFQRVVKRTSASLRYDKFNTLRLKYNNDVSKAKDDGTTDSDATENRMDHVWIEFPHFRAILDSTQYFAMYIIVVDLLLYSEPLEKTRSERLEKIMLASDFSDLTGAPEMVEMLQNRIRQLEEIKMHFQVNERYLDRQGWKDRIVMDQDLAGCEDELFFMMKAITTSQQRLEDRNMQDTASGVLRWLISAKELAWHLIREKNESLLEFQLKDSLFDRTDNSDGSNASCIEIGRINGFNLLPNAIYPQIIAPYVNEGRGFNDPSGNKMLRVHWLMLEAIAGIPVVDYFEIDVVPLHVQLEREVAKRLFEYIFPGIGGSAFEGSGISSPFQVKSMLPTQEEEVEYTQGDLPETPPSDPPADSPHNGGTGTGAGLLEKRLQPTMRLSNDRQAKQKRPGLGISHSHTNLPRWSLFQVSNRSHSHVGKMTTNNKTSTTNSPRHLSRAPSQQSVASTAGNSIADGETTSKKTLAIGRRSLSSDRRKGDKDKDGSKDKEQPSDDLSQMMNRASNYMTLSLFKVHSLVLCLSYKGRGHRNLEDVHDLVFRLPAIEFRNKTWSNLDLALQMKKDVIRALISHTGAIIGNKFSHHRPSKQQQNRLRELANNNLLMSASSENLVGNISDEAYEADRDLDGQGSTKDGSVVHNKDGDRGSNSTSDGIRPSFTSIREGSPSRSSSYAASTRSMGLTMTKIRDRNGDDDGSEEHDGEGAVAYDNVPSTPPNPHHGGIHDHRGRTSNSVSRRITSLGSRLRHGSDAGGASASNTTASGSSHGKEEDIDDGASHKRKSRLILGGQKLLHRLPRVEGK